MICLFLLFSHFAATIIKSFAKAWILTKWQGLCVKFYQTVSIIRFFPNFVPDKNIEIKV